MKVVGVSGTETRNFALRLSPGSGGARVRVGDSADGGKRFIEDEMGREIGGGAKRAFHGIAVEIGDDQVFGFQSVIRNTARLDDHEAEVAGDPAGVAEGEEDEAATNQFEISLEDFFAKGFEFHELPTRSGIDSVHSVYGIGVLVGR